ncbi:MAG: DNA repair protein RadA [Rickettsiales bacterium]
MASPPKVKKQYRCVECGEVQPKWQGQCPGCGLWDSFAEEETEKTSSSARGVGAALAFVPLDAEAQAPDRFPSGLAELDRVLGGGVVRGSAVLLGGQPGIGKSTLLSKTLAETSEDGAPAVYVSGEESAEQVRMRFRRLKLDATKLKFLAGAEIERIVAALDGLPRVKLLVIDSIQTMFSARVPSAPGTVAQVRVCANDLVRYCKRRDAALVLVGHVTKDGQIAGPKLLEHMVDTVLYFEGEDRGHFRMVRAVKNRFGAAGEVGFFDMQPDGLKEVRNPSALFLSAGGGCVAGAAVCAGMEGSRPILLEVQALAAKTNMATPRRATVGWDPNRLAMMLAVLQVRCGVFLGDREIYLNVAGGVKITETAADAAVVAALLSSYYDKALPKGCAVFGEVGLSGEIRMTGHAAARVKEAVNAGFLHILCPPLPEGMEESLSESCKERSGKVPTISVVRHVRDVAAFIG